MGLKKLNYEIKEMGIILPEAYAIIKNLTIKGSKAKAEFVVQASRESAINLKPLETKTLHFTVDRNSNPYETAYTESKKQVMGQKYNVETATFEECLENGVFTDWQDDIV